MSQQRGFTLIELMIVVAIVSVLAAIAIPNFLAMQFRSRRAEMPTNLAAIKTMESAYHAEWDTYTSAGKMPDGEPQSFLRTWSGLNQGAWDALGWAPDGMVYAAYEAAEDLGDPTRFEIEAYTDLDGDGLPCSYRATQSKAPYLTYANNQY